MNDVVRIQPASADDSPVVAAMVGELLGEIMQTVGVPAFNFDRDDTEQRLRGFLRDGSYFVFVARDAHDAPLGFAALYEGRALYAEGQFGILAELYIRPEHRGDGLGHRLAEHIKAFGSSRGWRRIEVTTPPLPQFERTLAFYEREGFEVTGGRKLKFIL